jgi:hypothetical protein
MGAVPFQEAKWARLVKRRMSALSPMRRAAPDGPMPCSCCSWLPVEVTSSVQLGVGDLDLLVDRYQLVDQLGGQPAAGLAGHVPRAHAREQGAGLLRGQIFLRTAGHEFE